MPSASVVVRAPPRVALDALSEAATPPTHLVPNFSGASRHLPGRVPADEASDVPTSGGDDAHPVPIAVPTVAGRAASLSSSFHGHQRRREKIGFTFCGPSVSIWPSTLAMQKSPTIRAMNSMPEDSSLERLRGNSDHDRQAEQHEREHLRRTIAQRETHHGSVTGR